MRKKVEKTWRIEQLKAEVRVVDREFDESVMKKINKQALDPLGRDAVYIFEAIPSTNLIDSYYTRASEKTLKSYAKQLREGRALMNSHRWSEGLPIGYSFDGEFDKDEVYTIGRYYIQRDLNLTGINTDEIIRSISGGTVRDVSAGFIPGKYICSICGNDMLDIDKCEHIPGLTYDEELCFAWIEDAQLCETSLCFDGACPGAIIKKAVDFARERLIGPTEMKLLESALQFRFSQRSRDLIPIRKKSISGGDKEEDTFIKEDRSPEENICKQHKRTYENIFK